MDETKLQRFQIYLSAADLELVEAYARAHGIIAKTGRKTGKIDRSATIREAIRMLPVNGNSEGERQ